MLDANHPDHKTGINDTREACGRTWRFGANQYTKFWRSGPKDGTVVCSRDFPHGVGGAYLADGVVFNTFEKAAQRAMTGAKREYERALEIVRRYETPENGSVFDEKAGY